MVKRSKDISEASAIELSSTEATQTRKGAKLKQESTVAGGSAVDEMGEFEDLYEDEIEEEDVIMGSDGDSDMDGGVLRCICGIYWLRMHS